MTWRSYDTPPPPALTMIEVSSIARGMQVADDMLKAADVELVLCRTICSGKFMVLVAGELTEVEASIAAGLDTAAECAIDHVTIPNVHPDVYPTLSSSTVIRNRAAMGILESYSVASLIEAVDYVAKEALVEMVQCRLAMAIGGKAYLVFTGAVDDVRESLEAGSTVVEDRGLLVNKVVIPNPRRELFDTLV